MEPEVEGRVQSLPYKVRSVSRESAAQKAVQVLDPDLRTHWSTSTNAKEWLVLELEESCLLSHIRIHNKSVLEWEISIGLRFKLDTYLKVRPRCEAPRRDITYHVGYQPCCFVRISCIRGNPIAIFHVQLMGIPVPGLEPELQPVVDHVLPHVIAHIRDPQDIYIQLLQDISSRLSPFLSHLEVELAVGTDGMESSIRFLAMLVGPFYPILKAVGGRENDKAATAGSEPEATKSNQPTVFTVSSNFQAPPKRVRSPGIMQPPSGLGLAQRPDAVVVLLRAACRDTHLGNLCRKVARLLRKLNGSSLSGESLLSVGDSTVTSSGVTGTGLEEGVGGSEPVTAPTFLSDYSSIFGEDYRILDDDGVEIGHAGVLDVAAVEEGLIHILFASASQPIISRRLADSKSDLIPVLPLVQAMLPALRPPPSTTAEADNVDETFWQWQSALTQRGLSQVVALSTSPSYRSLLDACAGYLASYSPAHEKAACVLIDLCAGPLAPWLPMVVAKIDLAIELLGDLLGIIQAVHGVTTYGRAALVYLMLALSGHLDDVLPQYKDVKHHVLFLIEMLEPFLIPAITPVKSTIAFGDVSAVLDVKQEQSCALALDLLRAAIQKPAVLPTMEAEWKRGYVTPSVLLSILAPHVPQPPGIDARGNSVERGNGPEPVLLEDRSGTLRIDSLPNSYAGDEEAISKGDLSTDGSSKVDISEDPNLLFAPLELKNVTLPSVTSQFEGGTTSDTQKLIGFSQKGDGKTPDAATSGTKLVLDAANAEKYFSLQSEYLQLVNSQERELRALEFTRFATELHSRRDISLESHQAAIDALLLAAECHLNPLFMVPSLEYQEQVTRFSTLLVLPFPTDNCQPGRKKTLSRTKEGLERVFALEEERDKAVLSILLDAAEWDSHGDKTSGEDATTETDENMGSANRVRIFKEDSQAEDALTLIREHQGLLCAFFVRQLQRERHSMYEVLLQGLLLILDFATKLSTPPVQIIDVILQCAERLNNSIMVYYSQVKDGSTPSEPARVYGIRRQWALLRRLVLAASGARYIKDDHDILTMPEGRLPQTALIPAEVWLAKIEEFPRSSFTLVRYVGWMALARYAKYYKEAGLLLVSDVEQLTNLLVIFSDELYSVLRSKQRKSKEIDVLMEAAYNVATGTRPNGPNSEVAVQEDQVDPGGLVKALHPELDLVFPALRSQFSEFAESILESVCELLKALPSSSIPDLLSWFSEICRQPFPASSVKGYVAANVKYVILCLLEVIVVEHMEAIVPELPRLLDILLSLCSSTYSDVPLLESVLAVLKPIISHATARAASVEDYAQTYSPGMSFESLCFDAILVRLKMGPDATHHQQSGESKSALVLFLAGKLLSDLSVSRRNDLIASTLQWTNFSIGNSATTFYDYLRAFQTILEECGLLLERLSGEPNGNIIHDEKPSVRKSATQALFALTAPTGPPLTPRRQEGTSPALDSSCIEYEESEQEHSTVEDEGAAGSVEEAQDDPSSSEAVTDHTPEDEQEASVDDGSTSLDSDLRVFNPSGSAVLIEEFKRRCSELVDALGPALETCWKIHPQLTSKTAHLAAKCLYYSGFQGHPATSEFLTPEGKSERTSEDAGGCQLEAGLSNPSHPIEVLANRVLKLQEAHCWQVASVIMDYLLSLLRPSASSQALSAICIVLQYQCSHAPRVAWRLQASQWLAKALPLTGMETLNLSSDPLIRLLCNMLDHSEPEQRFGALQQLRKLIRHELDWTLEIGPDEFPSSGSPQEPKLQGLSQVLVASTWEKVATTAASDPLLGLRKEAMELLLKFVPFAKLNQLQSFLKSSDAVLPTSTSSGVTINPGPLTRLALMVLSRSCLYIPEADVSLIPARVWDTIKLMADAKTGGVFAQPERALCQALLKLQEHGESAKETLKNIISGNAEKPSSGSSFAPVREAVLEVLARLCAVWSKEDSTTSAADDLAKELEEAEIELELVSQERLLGKEVTVDTRTVATGNVQVDARERLMQLKSQTLAEERNNMKAVIAARREKQRIARRDRQLATEIAAAREIELLKELDRERTAEAEREIERQRTLEKERAKTREMRHTLEMEAERRSQREYQRELEQRESGAVRSARRGEFASSTPTPTSSRPRERYRERERESGRPVQEGSSRSSGAAAAAAGGGGSGSGGRESGATPPATPTSAAGNPGGGSSSAPAAATSTATATAGPSASSRSHNSGFPQAGRDRDERGGYEDSGTEGNGVSRGETGDGSNFGDGDGGGSGVDGGSSGHIASSQRQGSTRSSRLPRQIVERRERDSRREGKWERKQT
ncbi:unnamed protein product [Calypogeia fissa]